MHSISKTVCSAKGREGVPISGNAQPRSSRSQRRLGAVALALMWACLAGNPSNAAPAVKSVRGEIEGLLSALRNSKCEFQRNGTWHSVEEANTHLVYKLHQVEKRTTLRSAEEFIEMAGSVSSVSQQPYFVRCQGIVQPSADWFAAQLRQIRTVSGQ